MRAAQFVKSTMIRLGPRLPRPLRSSLVRAINLLEMGQWLDEQGYLSARCHVAKGRKHLFEFVAQEVGHRPALYLEFGVHEGQATEAWSRLLTHPQTVLHGFDSFEGLPEAWGRYPKGHFSTQGLPPAIDDPRVRFFKGWFHETLPCYSPPPREVVILNMDADLYSSTAYVLRTLRELIRPGAYVLFNDLCDWAEEGRAAKEFIEQAAEGPQLLARDSCFAHVAFRFPQTGGSDGKSADPTATPKEEARDVGPPRVEGEV